MRSERSYQNENLQWLQYTRNNRYSFRIVIIQIVFKWVLYPSVSIYDGGFWTISDKLLLYKVFHFSVPLLTTVDGLGSWENVYYYIFKTLQFSTRKLKKFLWKTNLISFRVSSKKSWPIHGNGLPLNIYHALSYLKDYRVIIDPPKFKNFPWS